MSAPSLLGSRGRSCCGGMQPSRLPTRPVASNRLTVQSKLGASSSKPSLGMPSVSVMSLDCQRMTVLRVTVPRRQVSLRRSGGQRCCPSAPSERYAFRRLTASWHFFMRCILRSDCMAAWLMPGVVMTADQHQSLAKRRRCSWRRRGRGRGQEGMEVWAQ